MTPPTGDSECKMAGAGFHSFAKQSVVFRPRIAPNKITVLRIATVRRRSLREDCHRPDLAACIPCYQSRGAWQSAVTLRAVCQGIISIFESRAVCQGIISIFESGLPRDYFYIWERFAKGLFLLLQATVFELSKWVNPSTHHFTSTGPLFVASYSFDTRLSI
jgi:hypothetical protein